jgi:methanethiol S-methyltransferase
MMRSIAFLYGILVYGVFFLTFLYLIGFVGNLLVPKSIDTGSVTATGTALLINILLIALFGVQHSVMARPAFKQWWTRIVPAPIERSTYVLLASAVLILLFWQWRPMGQPIWNLQAAWAQYAMWAIFAAGFGLVLLSTFVIDHFDLFGLRQVTLNLRQKPYAHGPFTVRFFYRFVRHPLYAGFLMAFWATPAMTVGHLLFAAGMTGYILIAIRYEERDLVTFHGDAYSSYRSRVPMLVPRFGRTHASVKAPKPVPPAH